MTAEHANTAAIYASASTLSSVLGALPSYISQADAAAFGSELSIIYKGYLANLSGVVAARITNEVLTDPNDWLGIQLPKLQHRLIAPISGHHLAKPLRILFKSCHTISA